MMCLAFLVSSEASPAVKTPIARLSPLDSSLSNKWLVHATVFTRLRVFVYSLRHTRLSAHETCINFIPLRSLSNLVELGQCIQ